MSGWQKIYCCGCEVKVVARLTDGAEVYPRRPDLAALPFWRCDICGNHVGCHHKTENRTRPLGVIPTAKLRAMRRQIHAVLDPLWKTGSMKRGHIYALIGKELGRSYHTGNLRTEEEARRVLEVVHGLEFELEN